MENAIKIWKKLGIVSSTLEFDCGGDSMGNTSFTFFDKDGEEVESEELTTYFDNAVYDHVEFYVNSDGHYQGESGTVEITLDEEEENFEYSKTAQSEYSETQTSEMEVELSPKMVKFIKENVLNINGGEGSDVVVNFSRDFIMTDEQETLLEEIKAKIEKETSEFTPELENEDGEMEEWFTYTTNEEGDVLTIKGNSLKISIRNSYTEFKDSD
jgi:DNA replication initiation complex subunit (GINS family)